ncbi:uncharacterized protein LOC110632040 isoform X1 [Hevea brasiliensis]|uniref:uncharacterized protein LOC110632040 isoform X1 n=1 Tax=Hevea brasiliensis TaxID=3981 RepID=UPI0025E20B8A|nr:uncharacterized protein LOC110632040 isoform X1 [Hevea brasiliensis]
MAENASLPAPPVFKGENYNFWSVKLKAFLMAYDMWETVEKGFEPLLQDNPTIAEMKKQKEDSTKNFKVLSFLHSAVDDSIFPRIMGATTTKSAWDALQEEFQGLEKVRAVKLLNLRREFQSLTMNEEEIIKDYVSKLVKVVNEMKIYGENISDQMIVDNVLASIPNKFEPRIAAIEESKDLSKLSINELIGSLQAQEQIFNLKFEKSTEGAFLARNNFKDSSSKGSKFLPRKYSPCGICKKTSHEDKDCWHKGKPQCFKCKRFGHVQKACRFKEQNTSNTSNLAQEKEEEEFLF